MNHVVTPDDSPVHRLDSGLRALCGVAAYYRIAVDPMMLQRKLALTSREADDTDLLRGIKFIGMKGRLVTRRNAARLVATPTPAIVRLRRGGYSVFGGKTKEGRYRLVDPITHIDRAVSIDELWDLIEPEILLLGRSLGGKGFEPKTFGFRWFLPSIWRYRIPLSQVLITSLFIQIFALITPLFFQVVVDKVLTHKGYSTLVVLVAGIVIIGLFDAILQFLRTYALSHTTNRIDVELGHRMFRHMMRLPLSYFETRAAGQTLARVRELENIRAFLTGQGLFCALDFVLTFVFVAVLCAYSWSLTLVVVAAIPVYFAIGTLLRPPLRDITNEKFNRGALSQQFLVEAVVGMQTIKSSAVEPVMEAEWEEKLAAYVRTSFDATPVERGRAKRNPIRQSLDDRIPDPVRRSGRHQW